jgi:hypothetical protein
VQGNWQRSGGGDADLKCAATIEHGNLQGSNSEREKCWEEDVGPLRASFLPPAKLLGAEQSPIQRGSKALIAGRLASVGAEY